MSSRRRSSHEKFDFTIQEREQAKCDWKRRTELIRCDCVWTSRRMTITTCQSEWFRHSIPMTFRHIDSQGIQPANRVQKIHLTVAWASRCLHCLDDCNENRREKNVIRQSSVKRNTKQNIVFCCFVCVNLFRFRHGHFASFDCNYSVSDAVAVVIVVSYHPF